FDKTGTITEGQFQIVRLIALDGTEDELLRLAAAAESSSDHTLAHIIVDQARDRNLQLPPVEDARVLPGRGAECSLAGRVVRAGSAAFLAENGVRETEALLEEADRRGATAILVSDGERLAGAILLRRSEERRVGKEGR